jgi:hypothetical protein
MRHLSVSPGAPSWKKPFETPNGIPDDDGANSPVCTEQKKHYSKGKSEKN